MSERDWGREWERERMNIRMKQPASVPDALGQVPTLVPHKQWEGWVTATGRGWGQSVCVCVCARTRVHVRACVYLCMCSSQKRMSVWQVLQNHPSRLVIWVCILHINLYYSLSFSVISCLLMMDQTSFTIFLPILLFSKIREKRHGITLRERHRDAASPFLCVLYSPISWLTEQWVLPFKKGRRAL